MTVDRQSGFTLLETLVAMAILSIALVALFRAVAGGMQGLDRTDRSAIAVAIAASRLEAADKDGVTSGSEPGGYVWRVDKTSYAEPGAQRSQGGLLAQWVTVSVRWQGSAVAQPSTLMLRSLAMETAP